MCRERVKERHRLGERMRARVHERQHRAATSSCAMSTHQKVYGSFLCLLRGEWTCIYFDVVLISKFRNSLIHPGLHIFNFVSGLCKEVFIALRL